MESNNSDPCTKCGNAALPEKSHIGNGITSRPCPICGNQNYNFTARHRKTSGAADIVEKKCKRCQTQFFIDYHGKRDYCDDCLSAVRSKQMAERNRKRRESGEPVGISF